MISETEYVGGFSPPPPIGTPVPPKDTYEAPESAPIQPTQLKMPEMVSPDYVPPKPSWFWLKNSAGESSASLTFATISFVVIVIWILLSIFETIVVGEATITSRPPPTEGLIIALLGTTFSLYFGRRFSDRRRPALLKE